MSEMDYLFYVIEEIVKSKRKETRLVFIALSSWFDDEDSLFCPPQRSLLEEAAEQGWEPDDSWVEVINQFDIMETHGKYFHMLKMNTLLQETAQGFSIQNFVS